MLQWIRSEEARQEADPKWWAQMGDMTQTLFQRRRKMLGGSVKQITKNPIDWPAGVSSSDRIDAIEPQQVNALCKAIAQAMAQEGIEDNC